VQVRIAEMSWQHHEASEETTAKKNLKPVAEAFQPEPASRLPLESSRYWLVMLIFRN